MQVKLLRVLDGSSYYRVGGVKKVVVDVRLIAATNQDLKQAVREGRFRSDLYRRLCQIRLSVPALRDRQEDVLPLAEFYLATHNPTLKFSSPVAALLRAYSWPGNVRELRNVVIRSAVFASGPEILPADLPEEFTTETFAADLHSLAALPKLERSAIAKALEESRGHQQRAATRLGISKRTLQRKIKSYGLIAERIVSIAG
jgi:DNA-binding NtrC family response regulator